jgi:hypothetical protein
MHDACGCSAVFKRVMHSYWNKLPRESTRSSLPACTSWAAMVILRKRAARHSTLTTPHCTALHSFSSPLNYIFLLSIMCRGFLHGYTYLSWMHALHSAVCVCTTIRRAWSIDLWSSEVMNKKEVIYMPKCKCCCWLFCIWNMIKFNCAQFCMLIIAALRGAQWVSEPLAVYDSLALTGNRSYT